MLHSHTTIAGERLDLIVYDYYGDVTMLGEVLLANPGLAQYEILPEGVVIQFPEKTMAETATRRLWD